MAVKFSRSNAPLSGFYTVGGRGKTTTALSAKNPVLLDFEGTSYRAVNPQSHPIVIDLGSATWEEIDEYTRNDPDKLIAGRRHHHSRHRNRAGAIEALKGIVGRGAPKLRQRTARRPYAGWTALRDQMFNVLRAVHPLGQKRHLHLPAKRGHRRRRVVYGLSVIGKSKEFVLANSDMIGEIILNKDGTNSIDYSMRLGTLAKTRCKWGVDTNPSVCKEPTFIGDEIARYISEINERKQSEAKAIQPKPEHRPRLPLPPPHIQAQWPKRRRNPRQRRQKRP